MATTLADYYRSIGQSLPSLQQRAGIFQQKGGQGPYRGTAQQNTWLLNALKGAGLPQGSVVAPASPQSLVEQRRQALTEAMRGLEDPQARMARLRNEAGVSEAEKTLADLMRQLSQQEELLTGLEPGINERTGALGMTEAQRQRLLASERQPLTEAFERIARAKGTQQETLSARERQMQDMLRAAGLADERTLAPLQAELQFAEQEAQLTREREKEERDRQDAMRTAAKKSSGGSAKQPTQAQKKTADIKALENQVQVMAGRDGYIGHTTWRKAKDAWLRQGYSAGEFDRIFGKYRNPSHADSYDR